MATARQADPRLGIWRATWQVLQPHVWAFAVSDLLIAVLGAVFGALSDDPNRLRGAVLGALFAALLGAVFVALYALIRMPYRQRDALRSEIAEHMASQHPDGLMIIDAKSPSKLKQWNPHPQAGAPNYLMAEVPIPYMYNESDRTWIVKMWLWGRVEGFEMRLDNDLWLAVAREFPEAAKPFLQHPIELPPGKYLHGTVPFLMDFDEELQDKGWSRAELILRDITRDHIQHSFELSLDDTTVEYKWAVEDDESGGD